MRSCAERMPICDTCKQDTPVVMRVVIAQGYNRSLARPLFNCPSCYEKKESTKKIVGNTGGKTSA